MDRNKGLLVFLLFVIPILSASERQINGSRHQLAGVLQSFFQTTYKTWLQEIDETNWNFKYATQDNELTSSAAVKKQKKTNNPMLTRPTIESSIAPAGTLQIPYFLRFGNIVPRENRQVNSPSCTCQPTPACRITCTSVEMRCRRTCTHSTVYTAEYYWKRHHSPSLSTSVTVYNNGCDTLNSRCVATVGAALAMAIAAAVAVAVAVPVGLQLSEADRSETEESEEQINNFLDGISFVGQQTPANGLAFPLIGIDFPDDGCGDNSVRFSDGNCYPVLRRGPCDDPLQWITLDPVTIKVVNKTLNKEFRNTNTLKWLISGPLQSTSLWSSKSIPWPRWTLSRH